MSSQLWGVAFGIGAACCWGAGDFSGGAASRRGRVIGVVLASEVVGVSLLWALALLLSEPVPALADLLCAGVAGIAGTVGLVALYAAMASGQMAVAAPVTAVVTASVPVVAGALLEGMASGRQLVGFALGLTAVWLVSRGPGRKGIRARELGLPVLAGIGFAVFLILIDRVSERALYWPLVASRTASIAALAAVAAVRRSGLAAARQLPLAALAGVLDTGGNLCYALATRYGRLDAAAVLSSMGPAITVLLARFVLKEAISRRQWLGVAAGLAAVVLITP